ncbi:type-2 ice-structuring protein-like protein [Leptotrombidium deliense]|uniref:Type-2 ice-structuring protein-like protein n=1 Tax=Leptotrombidium deliense TaxID=299467 RepID=A0A443SUB2_9ACAR|nr:type-2 ice-structuring protein-like protein [Leptotrombidium deliense]
MTFIRLMILFVFVISTDGCREGWKQNGNKCFKFVPRLVTYDFAAILCKNVNASLLSVHSDEELQVIQHYVTTFGINNPKIWLGATRDSNNHQFRWVDRSPFDFSKYNNNCPTNSTSDNCLLEPRLLFMV